MSYLVLARRLRPQTFDEVVGQRAVVQTLRNALSSGRIHHAFLFCGPRGTGKTTTARILAKAINCEQGPTPDPCNQCPSCREIASGTSVDVLEIDGASNTGVDDVRQLRENARYLPVASRRKIYIIDEVHMLSVSAFNALLKTLEEPPEHVHFIFATTEPHRIPVTILSRCQRHDLGRVSNEDLVGMLATRLPHEGIHIDAGGLELVVQAAEGSVRDALSLVDQVVSYAGEGPILADTVREALGLSDRETLLSLSEALLARNGEAALGVADRVFQQGQDLVHFTRSFLSHLRDLTVVALVRDPTALVQATPQELERMRTQVGQVSPLWLQQLFDRFAVTAEQVSRSDTPRLVLEMGLVGLLVAEPLEPLGDLLERLEALEQSTPPPPRGPTSSGGDRSGPSATTRQDGSPTRRAPRDRRKQPARGRESGADGLPAAPTSTGGGATRDSASPSAPTDPPANPPAARPAPSPAGSRSSLPAEPLAAWEQLVREASRASRRLSASLYRVEVLDVAQSPDAVRVEGTVAPHSMEQQQLLGDRDVIPNLERHLSEALGRAVTLSLRVAERGAEQAPAGAQPPEPGTAAADAADARAELKAPTTARAASAPDASPLASLPGEAPPPPATASATGPPYSGRSLCERDEAWRRKLRETRRTEALGHAAVRDALEVLGGTVSEIHVVEE